MPVEIATGVYVVQTPQTPQYENSRAGGYTSVYTNLKYQKWGIAVENSAAKRAQVVAAHEEDVELYQSQLTVLNERREKVQAKLDKAKLGKVERGEELEDWNADTRKEEQKINVGIVAKEREAKILAAGMAAGGVRIDLPGMAKEAGSVSGVDRDEVFLDKRLQTAGININDIQSEAEVKRLESIITRNNISTPTANKFRSTARRSLERNNVELSDPELRDFVVGANAHDEQFEKDEGAGVARAEARTAAGAPPVVDFEERPTDSAERQRLIDEAQAELDAIDTQIASLEAPELEAFDPLAAARLEYAEKFPSFRERRTQKKAADTLTAFYDAEIQKELDKLPPDATPADRQAARQRGIDNVQAFFSQVSPPPKSAEEVSADQEERRKESARLRAAEEDFRTEEEFRRTATDDQLRARELQDRRDQINRKTDELDAQRADLERRKALVSDPRTADPDPEVTRGRLLQIDDELREIDRQLGILTEGDARIGQELATLRERDPALRQAAEQERLVQQGPEGGRAALGLQFPGSAQLQDTREVDQAAVQQQRDLALNARERAFEARTIAEGMPPGPRRDAQLEAATALEQRAVQAETAARSMEAQPRQTQAVREAQVRSEERERELDRADAAVFRERSLFDPEAEAARIEAERMEAQGRGLIGEERRALEETRQRFDEEGVVPPSSAVQQRSEAAAREEELLRTRASELRGAGLEAEALQLEEAADRRFGQEFQTPERLETVPGPAGGAVMQAPITTQPVLGAEEAVIQRGAGRPFATSPTVQEDIPLPEAATGPSTVAPTPSVQPVQPVSPVSPDPLIDDIEFQPAAPAQEGQFTGIQTTTPQEPTDLPVQTVEQQGAQFMLEASKQADMLSKQPRKVKRLTSNTQYGPVVEQMYLTNKQLDKPQTTQVIIEKIQETYRDDPETQENAVELYLALEQLDKRSGTAGVRPEDNAFK